MTDGRVDPSVAMTTLIWPQQEPKPRHLAKAGTIFLVNFFYKRLQVRDLGP